MVAGLGVPCGASRSSLRGGRNVGERRDSPERRAPQRNRAAGSGERCMTWLCMFIPIHLCELYHQQGWEVSALGHPHGFYSMLAVREVG